jgi:predicted transcriptional regulator
MSVTIPFPPDIEAKLRERAAASGKDVDSFVREAVEEKLGLTVLTAKSEEQWAGEFAAWMREVASRSSNYSADYIADDSRESIYEGRGE